MKTGVYNSRCIVCNSTDRKTLIETLLLRGVSAELIANKINDPGQRFISSYSIRRHRRHVPQALIEKLSVRALNGALAAKGCDLETLKAEEARGLLLHCVGYRGEIQTLIDSAKFQGNMSIVTGLIRARTELLVFEAKLLHEIGGSVTVTNQNLLISPDWLRFRTALVKGLSGSRFAEARAVVCACLAEAEKEKPQEIGVTGADANRFPEGTDKDAPSFASYAARPTPPVLLLEQYSDSKTPERVN
jgi:hypothetical protein